MAPGRGSTMALDLWRRRLQYEMRTMAADHPAVYLRFVRRAHAAGPGKVLAADTELVIDGYTRSASTFAVVAFQLAQPRPVRVARHTHAPAQLIAAARRGVPVLVCTRPPEATVLSAVIREPHVAISQALRSYARFYAKVLPYSSSFTVATFAEVTTDFGVVIDRINERYGTAFARFEHDEASAEKCFELIELRSRRGPTRKAVADFQSGLIGIAELHEIVARHGDEDEPPLHETMVARPSAARNAMKASLRARYNDSDLAPLRRRAESAYEHFLSAAARGS
jgi:hypothetical protein